LVLVVVVVVNVELTGTCSVVCVSPLLSAALIASTPSYE